jgi:hypothetical protein
MQVRNSGYGKKFRRMYQTQTVIAKINQSIRCNSVPCKVNYSISKYTYTEKYIHIQCIQYDLDCKDQKMLQSLQPFV